MFAGSRVSNNEECEALVRVTGLSSLSKVSRV